MRPPGKNRAWPRPLADFVNQAMSPALAKNGFGEADILLHWDEIAGERLVAVCEPIKIQWPARGAKTPPDAPSEPAVLVLRVEGAFALEVQHVAPLLVERINRHLGWRCIGRVALRQGPLERAAVPKKAPPPRDPSAEAAAAALLGEIGDEALQNALIRLGGRVLSGRRAP